MKIRHVTPGDLNYIMAIENANFGDIATSFDAMMERVITTTDTFLIAVEDETDQVVGYIEGPVVSKPRVTDDLFEHVKKNPVTGGWVAVTSLAVRDDKQGLGIGKSLILALKIDAAKAKRKGIALTCEEHLIPYYEKAGFVNQGKSDSTWGGHVWYDMVWENTAKWRKANGQA
jgi:predicted N-acetyltransferase YhbS